MLYLSASDKQNVIDYVESRKCEAYLQEIANNLPFALEFSKRVSAFKIRSTEVTSQRSARTLLLWKALRGVVKTGWIREYHGPARAKKRGLKGAWHKYKKERDFVIRNLIRYRESRFPNPRLETRILVKFEEREELGVVEHDYVPRVAVHQVLACEHLFRALSAMVENRRRTTINDCASNSKTPKSSNRAVNTWKG